MTSIVFPGQGSQFTGMSKDFYDNFAIAKSTFDEIQDYVKINLKNIIFKNEENLMNITNYTQICVFTASISIFKTFENECNIDLSNIDFMLGHSLGEYTALACSKKINLQDCSLILKKRGELMNNAVIPNETGMVALIGCNSEKVEKILFDNNLQLQIANDNSPMQIVVSGDVKELERSREIFIKNNVKKFVKLNVSSAFHSKFMNEAQLELFHDIDKLDLKKNNIKIVSNYTAEASNDSETIKNSLKYQMANKVRWTDSILKLESIGQKNIIEIGPGKVLSGLINRITNSFDIRTISEIKDISDK